MSTPVPVTDQNLSLLTTKLYIPPPRQNQVPRPRLIERLDEGLGQGHRLTLVSAPAGFGKTTLVTEWVCSLPREVTWISLDEGDNDPVQFLNYLVAALQQVDPRIGQTVRQLLGSPQLPSTPSLVTGLINDVLTAAVPLVLVLDDYQLVSAPAVHQAVEFLLERQPRRMHLVISTREDPPLPLHRFRVRGQVTEIRDRDLRFSEEEAAAFLSQTMGLELSAEAVAALEARTEGWIAGLQLAALALQEGEGDVERFVASFTGDDRYIADYLVTEVLQRQPEETRGFLQQTAILDRLSAPLCNAITGRQDSQTTLEQLEAANLFLVPLDHRREWYRYHRLFVEALRTTLDLEEQVDLHRLAAGWYEAQGFLRQAIQHAIHVAQAQGRMGARGAALGKGIRHALRQARAPGPAWDEAERLVRLAAEETLSQGQLLTLGGWLDALPDERVRTSGDLATYKGWVLALTGEMSLAVDYADAAERTFRGQGRIIPPIDPAPDVDLGRLLALRSFLAVFGRQEYEEAIELAAGALRVLAEDQARWQVMALWTLAESQERTANITEAIATLQRARRAGRMLGKQVFAVTVELFLATALNHNARRREAVAVCEDALAWYSDEMGQPWPVAGLLYSRLGTLFHEANQLDWAREYLDRGLALSEQLALEGSTMFCLAFAVPTLHVQGETEAALKALRQAHQYAVQTGLADPGWYLALEASIRLQRGDLPAVLRWAESTGLSSDDEPDYLRVDMHLVYARLLLAQGRLPDARRLLARLERFVRERGLYRWLITVHILQALVAQRAGDEPTALDRLVRAVELAAPEDYVRAFLDEGPTVGALLPRVGAHLSGIVSPPFVDGLLAAFAAGDRAEGVVVPPSRVPLAALIEPLSERELEVLALIASGLTNREIAQELVIAVGTVKRHINNIYGKMGVRNRTQAVARARELGLL